MRTSRIYIADSLASGESIVLKGDTLHYLRRVLRLKVGDHFNLFNPDDGEFQARVTGIDRSQLTALINEPISNEADPKLVVHLGLGLSRGERMDYGIQKSTELGVRSITPLITSHTEVKIPAERLANRMQHWQKVAISACKQSGRNSIPVIHKPLELNKWFSENPGGLLLDQRGNDKLKELTVDKEISLIVGPEGGFSDDELEAARDSQYKVVKLGPRVMRTETAPVVALSLLQYLFGDFRAD